MRLTYASGRELVEPIAAFHSIASGSALTKVDNLKCLVCGAALNENKLRKKEGRLDSG